MAKFRKICLGVFAAIGILGFYGMYVVCFPFTLEKTIKIDRFLGKCPDHKDLPIYLKDIHFISARRMHYISTKIVITRDFNSQLKVQLEPQRCKSKEALDSCEPYPEIHLKNMCELLTINFQPWTPFVKSMKPPLRCPLKKDTYVSNNGTFDGGAFMALPVEGWYWKIHAKMMEENSGNLIMCLYIEGQIVNA